MKITYAENIKPSMALDTPQRAKIVFHGEGGYPSDRDQAHSVLTVGNTYTVKDVSVGNWVSYVYIEEDWHSFNTVLFSNVAD